MSELESYYHRSPATRAARKAVSRIEQEAMIKRQALQAAAQDELYKLDVREELAKRQAQSRIAGTYDLAEYAEHRATNLNRGISHSSEGNPGLEMILRSFEDTAAVTTRLTMYHYGTGR